MQQKCPEPQPSASTSVMACEGARPAARVWKKRRVAPTPLQLQAQYPLTIINVQEFLDRAKAGDIEDHDALSADKHLEGFATLCFKRLTSFDKHVLMPFASCYLEGKWSVGSFCAGTNAPVLAMMALVRCLNGIGASLALEHAFSAEINPEERVPESHVQRRIANVLGPVHVITQRSFGRSAHNEANNLSSLLRCTLFVHATIAHNI